MMTEANAKRIALLVKTGIERRREDKERLACWEHALIRWLREKKKASIKVCGVTLRIAHGRPWNAGPAARRRARATERIIIERPQRAAA